MEMIKVELVIEEGDKGLWGSVKYNDNLITDQGKDLKDLEHKLKALLQEFEGINPEKVVFMPSFVW